MRIDLSTPSLESNKYRRTRVNRTVRVLKGPLPVESPDTPDNSDCEIEDLEVGTEGNQ